MFRHLIPFSFLLSTSLYAHSMPSNPLPVLQTWSTYCTDSKHLYPKACQAYRHNRPRTPEAAQRFLSRYWRPTHPQKTLITGYYTPTYQASLQPTPALNTPLYARPPTGSKPCSRATINHHHCPTLGSVLAWMNRVDRFFLQIQGSGLLNFPDGSTRQVAYAGRNGYPYVAIGRWMLHSGRLQRPVSMQRIRHYLRDHPSDVDTILNQNPAFIYVRWQHPPRITGASGHGLTAGQSVAIDPQRLQYGDLISLPALPGVSTQETLVIAEDTGSAITGHHIDLYLGAGHGAEKTAGRLQALVPVRVWVRKNNDDLE